MSLDLRLMMDDLVGWRSSQHVRAWWRLLEKTRALVDERGVGEASGVGRREQMVDHRLLLRRVGRLHGSHVLGLGLGGEGRGLTWLIRVECGHVYVVARRRVLVGLVAFGQNRVVARARILAARCHSFLFLSPITEPDAHDFFLELQRVCQLGNLLSCWF